MVGDKRGMMAKIYTDTTRLVDFYRAASDKIVQLEELQKYKSTLVLTEQTITEFRRNRVKALNELSTQLRKTINDERPPTAAIIQKLPAQTELTDYTGRRVKRFLTI
jgi:hypothetical protein